MTKQFSYSELRKESERIDLARQSPLGSPLTLYVEPTNICNFRCTFCPESLDDYTKIAGGHHSVDLKAFSSLCAQIQDLGRLKVLQFYMMGEPFTNKLLPDFVAMARRMDVADRLIVTSNATLISEQVSERIITAGVDFARFSIYAATPERMRKVTGSKIPLARIVNNIATFRRIRDRLGLGTPHIYVKMIDSHNEDENRRFLDLFGPVADEVCIEPVMDWNGNADRSFANVDRNLMLDHEYFRHKKDACPMPFYTLVVHSDLRVSVCCVDWAKQAIVGDLTQQSLGEIWRGDRLREFRLAHLRGDRHTLDACKNCTYLFTLPDSVDSLSPNEYLLRLGRG